MIQKLNPELFTRELYQVNNSLMCDVKLKDLYAWGYIAGYCDASRYSKFEIQLYKSYNGNYMLDFNDRIPFSRLSTLPEFIIYLIKLKNYSCIIELDTYYQSDTIELEYEYEYERS